MSGCSLTSAAVRRPLVAAAVVLMIAVSMAAEKKEPGGKSDENAIRATVESYVAAYNRCDAKAVAAHWSDAGEWVSPSGQRFQGKQAIEKELAVLFASNKGLRIEVLNPSIRLVAPDAAIEEGTVRVIRPGAPASDSTYLAVHVKKEGHWKLDSVRETDIPQTPLPSSPLQELAWLVGEWGDESPDATLAATVTWTKNQTFLCYTFKASAPGADDLDGTQVIGWDPAARTIRSWMFDSDGGFGEGTWTKKDKDWIVKFSQVLPDGRKASATNIYTLRDANTFTWKSIGRKVGSEFLPNIADVKVVRKGTAKEGKAAEKSRRQGAKK